MRVLAQPLGGLIDCALQQGNYHEMRRQTNLVVDPGYHTLDWIVSKGVQPIPPRCGSFAGGMHAVLKTLATAISKEHQIHLDDYGRLEDGLRTGFIKLYGKSFPLAPYLRQVHPVINDALTAMVSSVGDGRDIDAIFLVGGAAPVFRDAVARRFPSHNVRVVSHPQFANVRGFQRVGEQLVQRHRVAV